MTMTATSDLAELRARTAQLLTDRLPAHIARLDWHPDQLAQFQRTSLRALLHHAFEHSPFHAARLAAGGLSRADIDRFEPSDLAELPIMTKADMMGNFDGVVTDRRLTRALVEQHITDSTPEPSLVFGDYVCLASGGSSGLRGIYVQTPEEYIEFCGSVTRRAMAAFLAFGGQPADGLTVGMVGAKSPIHSTGFAASVAAGPPIRLISAPATMPTTAIVNRLNAAQPPALIGYASKLGELSREQGAGRLRLRLVAVTSCAEMLTSEVRTAIHAAFDVAPINMFASTEGLVGHTEPGGEVFTFATDICIAECVDDAGRPVPDGTTSSRVLVTNLHNRTQPLIRYELTDRFTPAGISTAGFLRATVDGRADDGFRYGDLAVHPSVLTTALLETAAVSEYQVRQTPRGVSVSVVAKTDFDHVALTAKIERSLRQAGLRDPEIAISCVDAIPRDPLTGKVKRFLSLRTMPSAATVSGEVTPAPQPATGPASAPS
jgi:phenylacetate-coenzyme A ligase PaaK-like adenylate-forming protein